jgi:hypothetical protein
MRNLCASRYFSQFHLTIFFSSLVYAVCLLAYVRKNLDMSTICKQKIHQQLYANVSVFFKENVRDKINIFCCPFSSSAEKK